MVDDVNIYIYFIRKQHVLQFVFFNFIFGIYSREDAEMKGGAGIFSVSGFYLDIMS